MLNQCNAVPQLLTCVDHRQGVTRLFLCTSQVCSCKPLCRDGALGLTLDPQLMRDLTVLISSSVAGGMLLEAVKQPVINGYFIAGSVVGPGGLQLIKACRSCITSD